MSILLITGPGSADSGFQPVLSFYLQISVLSLCGLKVDVQPLLR